MDQFEAVNGEASAIEAFAATGGRFTDEPDASGTTSAMLVAMSGPEAIAAFAAAGGSFSDRRDGCGMTAASYVAGTDTASIEAFAAAGGTFKAGDLAAIYATRQGPETIRAFLAAGGSLDCPPDQYGTTPGMAAAQWGAKSIAAFVAGGGRFTHHRDKYGLSAMDRAAEYDGFFGAEAAARGQGAVAALEAAYRAQALVDLRAVFLWRAERARVRPPLKLGRAVAIPL